ncbi:MAG: DsbA family protein [Sandaracinaceae bacterium]
MQDPHSDGFGVPPSPPARLEGAASGADGRRLGCVIGLVAAGLGLALCLVAAAGAAVYSAVQLSAHDPDGPPPPSSPEPVAPATPPAVPPAVPTPPAAPTPTVAPTGASAIYAIPLGDAPVRGPAGALVTIVEFSDFQCPFCRRAQDTLEEVAEAYPREVRFAFKHNPLPFHRNAADAAAATLEARRQQGDAGFWRMHDTLFENASALSRDDLARYAAAQGLDVDAFRLALEAGRHGAAIEADQALATSRGARGTPHFFINGRKLAGAQPLSRFRQVIDEELRRARALVAAGTPTSQVYAAATRDGLTAEAPAERPAPTPPPPTTVSLRAPPDAPSRGPADAPVVIQEFGEYQCPFCQRVQPTLAQLRERYGPRVRMVWRDNPLPFHHRAMPAALAAREVYRQGGDDAFWAYHDLLFEHQRELDLDHLVALADQVPGIDPREVRTAVTSQRHLARIQQDIEAAAGAGLRGTPTFVVHDRVVRGAQPLSAFVEAVEGALGDR